MTFNLCLQSLHKRFCFSVWYSLNLILASPKIYISIFVCLYISLKQTERSLSLWLSFVRVILSTFLFLHQEAWNLNENVKFEHHYIAIFFCRCDYFEGNLSFMHSFFFCFFFLYLYICLAKELTFFAWCSLQKNSFEATNW